MQEKKTWKIKCTAFSRKHTVYSRRPWEFPGSWSSRNIYNYTYINSHITQVLTIIRTTALLKPVSPLPRGLVRWSRFWFFLHRTDLSGTRLKVEVTTASVFLRYFLTTTAFKTQLVWGKFFNSWQVGVNTRHFFGLAWWHGTGVADVLSISWRAWIW